MTNFPIKYIIVILAVGLAAILISPFLYSPEANDTVTLTTEGLANTSIGNVTKEGPYGNTSSPVKVAYIVGVHPLEYESHEEAVMAIKKLDKSLRYSYYIYYVNVTGGVNAGYETGRMNGQLLAEKYVVPDILANNFQLAMDIHSNKGRDDNYAVSWFLFVPEGDDITNKIAKELQSKITGIGMYDPPYASSPEYVTMPLIQNGTPAVLYEAYEYDSPEVGQDKAEKLLRAIESLEFGS
jgi:hypothetical protein